MSSDFFFKLLMVLLLSGFIGWVVFSRYDEEIGRESTNTQRQRYLPYLNATALPVLPLSLFCTAAIFLGVKEAFRTIAPMCFSIFMHIAIYYAILSPLLPFLRKRISARTCALLWLLPNYTYLTYCNAIMASNKPRFVLHLPGKLPTILFLIWIAGFAVVMIRAIFQHLAFRRYILKDTSAVSDPAVLKIWTSELEHARIRKPKFKLVLSDRVSTPLSIGFFNRSIRVVLPLRPYTHEELQLILRHEIIHICRGDSSNKFSMVFCCAMCWFNPLMWIAMRKSADDLELSCDETVLLNADDHTKARYADLILNTVADERGFSTCLSASPTALRYRLNHIFYAEKKTSGFLITAAICVLLFFTFGNFALSCGEFTGQDILFTQNGVSSLSAYELFGFNTSFDYGNGLAYCNNEADLKQYFADMKLSRINGNYNLERTRNEIELFFKTEESEYYIHLSDQILKLQQYGETQNGLVYYHVRSDIDWEYLFSLFGLRAIQDPALGFPPEMLFQTSNTSTQYHSGAIKTLTVNGMLENENVYFTPYTLVEITKPNTDIVNFTFSHEPTLPFQIVITDHTGKLIEMITYDTPASSYRLPFFDDHSYQCYVTFEDAASVLEMEYTFNMHYFTG